MKKIVKKINISLKYLDGENRPQDGYFEGGVQDPQFSDELIVWVEKEETYDESQEAFTKSGLFQVNIGGSRRSLFELGRYLIALSKYNTKDINYHDHIEEIGVLDEKNRCELIIHHPIRFRRDIARSGSQDREGSGSNLDL